MVVEVRPRWERAGACWGGELAASAILAPDSAQEQRIQRLREGVLARLKQGKRIAVARAALVTEAYQSSEGEHPAARRARSLVHVLEEIPIELATDQLMVGTPASALDALEVFVEFMTDHAEIYDETPGGRVGVPHCTPGGYMTDEEKAFFNTRIWPYWQDRARGTMVLRELQRNYPAALHYTTYSGISELAYGGSLYHTVQDYRSVLEKGLEGLKAEIRRSIAELDPIHPTDFDVFERRNQYEAMLAVADAIITYANRCADLCDDLAKQAAGERVAELREMARICRKVPAQPAESWWEALQSVWFLNLATVLCEGGGSHGLGRFDQYLYPYLRDDLASGRLSRQQAQELLECFFLKFNEAWGHLGAEGSMGTMNQCKIVIGGMDKYGRDVTNDLTLMCLEAHAHIGLNEPILSARLHRGTPDRFLRRVLEVLRLGSGIPILLNDEALVSALVTTGGASLEDARNYADCGCQENVVDPNTAPGGDTAGRQCIGFFSLVKPIELALFDGVNPFNGVQVGPRTGDPRGFRSMAELVEAVRRQMEHAVAMYALVDNLHEYTFVKYYPCVLHNLLHPGPRRKGVDINAGACKYNWSGFLSIGLATGGDSLAAIDHLVYRTRQTSWDDLLAALKSNWAGYEELRQKCIRAPKYGVDDDYADGWARQLANLHMDAVEALPTPKGGHYNVGFISMGTYITTGRLAWATPDGRRVGEMLSDSSAPSQYAPAAGPTAAHNSNAKAIDRCRVPQGVTFNQKLSTTSVMSERDLSKWADLVRTHVDNGGVTVQYNVVNKETLIDAQQHPERYADLVVRVGGYNALFVELTKELQDSIIARAEQNL